MSLLMPHDLTRFHELSVWRVVGRAWFKRCCGQRMLKEKKANFRNCFKHVNSWETRYRCECCGTIENPANEGPDYL